MDPYEALVSGTPDDAVLQKQLAKGLRRDADFGVLGMVSGDAALSPVGRSLLTRSNNNAVKMGDNLHKQKRQRALQGYYDAMEAQMLHGTEHKDATLKATIERNKNPHAYQMRMAEAAMIRALNAGQGGGSGDEHKKLRSSDIKSLSAQGQIIEILDGLYGRFDEEGFSPGQQAGIPGIRSVNNFLGRYGVGSNTSKDIQDWWATYDKFYTLPERNEKFGATLTVPEKQAWAGANIHAEMTDEQIKSKLRVLKSVMTNWAHRQAKGYATEGYNDEAVYDFLGMEQPSLSIPNPNSELYPEGQDGPINLIPPAGGDELPDGITIRVK